MPAVKKAKLGIFSFTCCEGCQLEALEINDKLFELLGVASIVNSRLLKENNPEQPLDIAIVEGSIVSSHEVAELKKIRKRSKYLIALGSCACLGGIPAIRNLLGQEAEARIKKFLKQQHNKSVQGIGSFVKVDYFLHGCPIVSEEFHSVLLKLLHGGILHQYDAPVCVECKQNENTCLFLEGKPCLGSVSAGGCNSICINASFLCTGCRGLLEYANIPALRNELKRQGRSDKEIDGLLNLYNTNFSKQAEAKRHA